MIKYHNAQFIKHKSIYMSDNCNKKLTNWRGRQNAVPLKFDPKSSDAEFFDHVFELVKHRLEVAGEVISGVAED